MTTNIYMPKLGMEMTEGIINKWLKDEGEYVKEGDPLIEITSDKANVEIDAETGGYLLKKYYGEGEEVPVNQVIGVLGKKGEKAPEVDKESTEIDTPSLSEQPLGGNETDDVKKGNRILISPRAKKLAINEKIDYTLIQGTGPNGRIIENDVQNIIYKNEKNKSLQTIGNLNEEGEVIPLTGNRRVIAERMKESLRNSAQANHKIEVEMSELINLRKSLNNANKEKGINVTITDIFIKIVSRALKDNPIMNSVLLPDGVKLLDDINIGIAVAVKDGLLVPVIMDADNKTLLEITQISNELIYKANKGSVRTDEMSGGTFTITNLGMYDIDSFTAIINPPESAILAIGKINEKPVVKNGEIVINPIIKLSLTYDHRIIDGAPAAIFLKRIKELVETPYLLI